MREAQTVTTWCVFCHNYRAAALMAGVVFLIPAAHSRAQAPKEQSSAAPKGDPSKSKAQPKVKAAPRYSVPPTFSNVPYGTHPRQVLDFFKADTKEPAPLVVHIHGGGWVNGDKVGVGDLKKLLDSGISVASINYRFTTQAQEAGIKPPVKWPLEDAARAVQFLRSKAGEWNIDKTRVAATGGSAGACSSLWLAFHDDMAKPGSTDDPVARESTRLTAAAVNGAQTSLDPCSSASGYPTCGMAVMPLDLPAAMAAAATRSSSSFTTTAARCSTGSRNTRPMPMPDPAIRRSSSTIRRRTSRP